MPKAGGAAALFIDWIGAGGGVGVVFHGAGAGRAGSACGAKWPSSISANNVVWLSAKKHERGSGLSKNSSSYGVAHCVAHCVRCRRVATRPGNRAGRPVIRSDQRSADQGKLWCYRQPALCRCLLDTQRRRRTEEASPLRHRPQRRYPCRLSGHRPDVPRLGGYRDDDAGHLYLGDIGNNESREERLPSMKSMSRIQGRRALVLSPPGAGGD